MSPPGVSTCVGTGFSYVRVWKYDVLNPHCLSQSFLCPHNVYVNIGQLTLGGHVTLSVVFIVQIHKVPNN